jgi:NADPH2:quinone reductase
VTTPLVATRLGGPQIVQMRTVELGLRGPGEVTVEVGAAGMNPIDDAQRRRRLQLGSEELLAGPVALTFPFDERLNGVAALIGHRPDVKLAVAV